MGEVKSAIIAIITAMLAYLQPIADNIFAMVVLLGLNFIVGLLAGLISQNESFDWRKALQCIKEAAYLFVVVAAIFIIGRLNGNYEGSIWCVSVVVYAMCYFYAMRILRNLKALIPEKSPAYSVINFLYSTLSMELVKRIPALEEHIKKTNANANG